MINGVEFQIPIQTATSATNIHLDETIVELTTEASEMNETKLTIWSPSEYIHHPDQWTKAQVKFKKLHHQANLPIQGSQGAAGVDISSIETTTVAPGETKGIKTGLATELPPGIYLRIAPRSGNTLKGIFVNGGVIDADYCGEIWVILHNSSQTTFKSTPTTESPREYLKNMQPAK